MRSLSVRFRFDVAGPPSPTADQYVRTRKAFVQALSVFLSHPPSDKLVGVQFPALATFRLALCVSAAEALSERPDGGPFEELACALSACPSIARVDVVV